VQADPEGRTRDRGRTTGRLNCWPIELLAD